MQIKFIIKVTFTKKKENNRDGMHVMTFLSTINESKPFEELPCISFNIKNLKGIDHVCIKYHPTLSDVSYSKVMHESNLTELHGNVQFECI